MMTQRGACALKPPASPSPQNISTESKRTQRSTRWNVWTGQCLLLAALLSLISFGGFNAREAAASAGWLMIPPDLSTRLNINGGSIALLSPLPESLPDEALRSKLDTIVSAYDDRFSPYVYTLDVTTGRYVNLNGDSTVPAASVIKLPVLAALFEQVDSGILTPDTSLRYEPIHRAEGSGDLQYQKDGQWLSVQMLATKMIQISDNTATNILLDNLGGMAPLNERFAAWGLSHTRLNNWLPDLDGTNTISVRDMAGVLYNLLQQGSWLSNSSKTAMLAILQGTKNRKLLPAGLPDAHIPIAHKTGDIGWVLGDMGLVQPTNGHTYLMCVMVKRPRNNPAARTMIQDLSKMAYQYYNSLPPVTPPMDITALSH